MTLGEKILNMRKARGWSQEELADRAGVSRQAVSRWESGSAKPDADKIIAICDLFGVSADYLLRDNYEGGKTAGPAVPQKPCHPVNVRRIVLGIYATWSAIALFAMKFISSVSPKVYVDKKLLPSGETVIHAADGMLGFVLYYNLGWFLISVLIGIAVGLVLIWQGSPSLRKWILSVPEWLKGLGK